MNSGSDISDNIEKVRKKIADACLRSGRDAKQVTLIAVSKTMPVSDLREAMKAGMLDFGENKPQELRDKQKEITESELRWHMIGSLQVNKLKYVVGKTALIHSVDSLHLAEEINKMSEQKQLLTEILLEMNLAKESSKHGFFSEEIYDVLHVLKDFKGIKVSGLMTVAPNVENPEENRKVFRKMKDLMIDINQKNIDNICMDKLSMGMTGDYEIAVEEGATHVRVGTGIFGHRNYNVI